MRPFKKSNPKPIFYLQHTNKTNPTRQYLTKKNQSKICFLINLVDSKIKAETNTKKGRANGIERSANK